LWNSIKNVLSSSAISEAVLCLNFGKNFAFYGWELSILLRFPDLPRTLEIEIEV
jgi:hypothetical protein